MAASKRSEKTFDFWLSAPNLGHQQEEISPLPGMRLEGRKVEMTTLTQQLHKTKEGVLHVCGKVLAVGGCRAGLCGKRSQLSPWRTQPCQPPDPPQGQDEPISQTGGASGKTYLREDKKSGAGRGGQEKGEWKPAEVTPRSEEEVLQAQEQSFTDKDCSLWRTHSGAGLSWRTAPHTGAGKDCGEGVAE